MAALSKSVDDLTPDGDKPNTMKPNTEPWVVEPPSKTAICTITYPLPEIRQVYAVPIEVTYSDGASTSPVLSQRLRTKAINEFVMDHLKSISDHHALQFWAHKEMVRKESENHTVRPIDHILVVSQEKGSELPDFLDSLTKKDWKMKVVKQTRAAGGQMQHLPIFCRVQSLERITPDSKPKEYWQKRNILIQQNLRSNSLDSALSNSGAEGLLFDGLPKITKNVSSSVSFLQRKLTTKKADKVTALLRMKIKLDPYPRHKLGEEKNSAKVHLELDIAPVLQKGRKLSELLLDVFGRRILGSRIGQDFHDVRGMLLGLKVDRTYGPSTTAKSINTAGAITGVSFDHGKQADPSPPRPQAPPPRPQGRRSATRVGDTPNSADKGSEFTVQDVKLAKDIPTFLKNNEKFSVVSYFAKGMLHLFQGH